MHDRIFVSGNQGFQFGWTYLDQALQGFRFALGILVQHHDDVLAVRPLLDVRADNLAQWTAVTFSTLLSLLTTTAMWWAKHGGQERQEKNRKQNPLKSHRHIQLQAFMN